mmetsp:Transcript_6341/g.15708  ORF Transcript_6341/g.15708 Transcript_6341/m.15708 type:complete len:374 (-) Transcript_6341:88-1209(-)
MMMKNKNEEDASFPSSSSDGGDLARLREDHPAATTAELRRFLRARGENIGGASEQLRSHLDWRTEHGLDDWYHCTASFSSSSSFYLRNSLCCDKILDGTSSSYDLIDDHTLEGSCNDDEDDDDVDDSGDDEFGEPEIWYSCASTEDELDELDWRFASEAALVYERRRRFRKTAKTRRRRRSLREREIDGEHEDEPLPQVARILSERARDRGGHRILQFLPARMDLTRASEAVFALSVALYLERKLDRNSSEKLTVAVDVRGGTGWANPNPAKLLPFVRNVAGLLERHFPERMAMCLVYPVPATATLLWRVIRRFLDPATTSKIALVKGDSRTEAPPPLDAMKRYAPRWVLEGMEDLRIASFANEDDDGEPRSG